VDLSAGRSQVNARLMRPRLAKRVPGSIKTDDKNGYGGAGGEHVGRAGRFSLSCWERDSHAATTRRPPNLSTHRSPRLAWQTTGAGSHLARHRRWCSGGLRALQQRVCAGGPTRPWCRGRTQRSVLCHIGGL